MCTMEGFTVTPLYSKQYFLYVFMDNIFTYHNFGFCSLIIWMKPKDQHSVSSVFISNNMKIMFEEL